VEFEPLYFGDRLTIVNPRGVVGVVTLWSKVDYVMARLGQAGIDLAPHSSRIAVLGTLYGNGLREMLRNLLYNPQIQVLIICGHNRSGSQEELVNFFRRGLEPVDSRLVRYVNREGSEKVSSCRIRQTSRILDNLLTPELFSRRLQLLTLGDPKDEETLARLRQFFQDWQPDDTPPAGRLAVPLPEVAVEYFPSNPRGHLVVKDSPLAAWQEVLFLLSRFGRRVRLAKGERLELQHVKVVVERPQFDAEAELQACQVEPEKLRLYQAEILRGELRPDETYHYGHRLRTYFGFDLLAACADRLREDPEDRKSYLTLWDNRRDLKALEARPCLVTMYWRKFNGSLTLGATFRTHNALDAWLLNCYGLMAVQAWVAAQAGLSAGALTIVSHSLGLDPREMDRAMLVVGRRTWKMHLDPCGYFRVSLDEPEIVVEHRWEDSTMKEYRGRTALALQHQLARDLAISDLNHAMYLGRQLARAELALQQRRDFVQE
jgi:thymidylate synthase